jgi:hypothetical protein
MRMKSIYLSRKSKGSALEWRIRSKTRSRVLQTAMNILRIYTCRNQLLVWGFSGARTIGRSQGENTGGTELASYYPVVASQTDQILNMIGKWPRVRYNYTLPLCTINKYTLFLTSV